MLNFRETESKNIVDIVGILKELQLEEKTSSDGKDFIAGKATVKVDQEINGKFRECEIPVEIYANRLTKSGEESKLYKIVLKYKDQFTSLAACPEDQPNLASKVVIKGATISENVWADQSTGLPKSSYKIRSNFINPFKGSINDFVPQADFEVTGVILGRKPELVDDTPTGRLKVQVALVGYGGRTDVVEMIAESENAVNFIESNYADGDTVTLTGSINMSYTVKRWKEPQGFGPDKIREKTESCREFIITGGSPSGMDENASYDSNDIKTGLAERAARVEASKTKVPKGRVQSPDTKKFDF